MRRPLSISSSATLVSIYTTLLSPCTSLAFHLDPPRVGVGVGASARLADPRRRSPCPLGNALSAMDCSSELADGGSGLIPKLYSTIEEIEADLSSNNGHKHVLSNKGTQDHEPKDATKHNTGNSQPPPHLFLHFDVNETILIGDPAGGDTVHECLNKIIAKSAFVSTKGFGNEATKDEDNTNINNGVDANTALCRSPSSGNISEMSTHHFQPTHWWNGLPLEQQQLSSGESTTDATPPPLYTGWTYPPNTCSYYRTQYKKMAKQFTESSHGRLYRPLYEDLCHRLGIGVVPPSERSDNAETASPVDEFQNFLPAFFHTLQHYFPSKTSDASNSVAIGDYDEALPRPPKVTLVLRTFGQDLPRVAKVITAFAKGKHPSYPDYRNPDLILDEGDLYCADWRYVSQDGIETGAYEVDSGEYDLIYELHPYQLDDDKVTRRDKKGNASHSGDDEVLNFLQSKSIVGIQDNYTFWRDNNHAPWSGKPVWTMKTTSDAKNNDDKRYLYNHHHILLDDNIHNDPNDGAGGIRIPITSTSSKRGSASSYISLHGKEALALHGIHLVRVPTICPLLEVDWFVREIEGARIEWRRGVAPYTS